MKGSVYGTALFCSFLYDWDACAAEDELRGLHVVFVSGYGGLR